MKLEKLHKLERDTLFLLETRCVEAGGIIEGRLLTNKSLEAIERFEANELLELHKIPSVFMQDQSLWTHWTQLTDRGWELAGALRRQRAGRRQDFALRVIEELRAIGHLIEGSRGPDLLPEKPPLQERLRRAVECVSDPAVQKDLQGLLRDVERLIGP